MNNLTRAAILVLIIGTILVLFGPFLITRNGIISFKETGQIGDTIGGITAPITSLIGSVLVFLALRAQITANEIIQEQITSQIQEENRKKEMNYVSDLYEYFLKSLDDFEFEKTKGIEAIMRILKSIASWERDNAHQDNLIYTGKIGALFGVLKLAKLFLQQLEKSKIDREDKNYFKELMKHHVETLFEPYLVMENEKASCSVCGNLHNGIPFKFFELTDEIKSML